MAKKTSTELKNITGKRVLVRVDFNVPLKDRAIADDRRIVMALPTIKDLLKKDTRVILMSHLGRPTGDPENDRRYSLEPVAKHLSSLLDRPVRFVHDCVGAEVRQAVSEMKDGECCLLENLRFHDAETIKDKDAAKDPALAESKREFAQQLAGLADVYVNDAFGTCHRDNASMLTVPQLMGNKPKVSGLLVAAELSFLGYAMSRPEHPYVAILGGAKVSDKMGVIQSLAEQCDTILIGGAMAYTFMKAAGVETGDSLVEHDRLEDAKKIRESAGEKLMLPVDSVCAAEIKSDSPVQLCTDAIPVGMKGLDIGPKTIETYRNLIHDAKTVVWNGPMGVFEVPPFDAGTMAVAKAMAEATSNGATTIVGGGDSAAAIEAAGLAERVIHVSTGGGASLEFLEGKKFAAIEVLDDATL